MIVKKRLPRKVKKLYKQGKRPYSGLVSPFKDMLYAAIARRKGFKL